jgi:hypothetical protein
MIVFYIGKKIINADIKIYVIIILYAGRVNVKKKKLADLLQDNTQTN